MVFQWKKKDSLNIKSHYFIAHFISFILSSLGLILILLGSILLIFKLSGLTYKSDSPFADIVPVIAMQYGLAFGSMVLIGLLMMGIGQITKAVINNADQTREILKVLNDKPNN